jgi:hypothetical protein
MQAVKWDYKADLDLSASGITKTTKAKLFNNLDMEIVPDQGQLP